ncbi:MAG TPA: ATP phosphoribosyltransferase [Candidatus Eremiobacteraeota bacterium]|nr:MAG: ATP phosphoribosyltransferase [bacterium ADurb.Bin363]HPZ07543.1 ATP phosphoribosyltransferase [Candidatus Eremiobacteraeota bacterium]
MKPLSIALPTGKLLSPSIEFLNAIGINCDSLIIDDRRRIYFDNKHKYKLILLDPFDIPVYIEHGAADLGIVTKDVLLERNRTVLELLELDYGRGKLVLARSENNNFSTLGDIYCYSAVATNYPNIAFRYFSKRGIPIEIIKVSPPVEVALESGLADLMLTCFLENLPDKEIIEIDEIAIIPCLIIANRVSFKNFFNQIYYLIQRMKELIANRGALNLNPDI